MFSNKNWPLFGVFLGLTVAFSVFFPQAFFAYPEGSAPDAVFGERVYGFYEKNLGEDFSYFVEVGRKGVVSGFGVSFAKFALPPELPLYVEDGFFSVWGSENETGFSGFVSRVEVVAAFRSGKSLPELLNMFLLTYESAVGRSFFLVSINESFAEGDKTVFYAEAKDLYNDSYAAGACVWKDGEYWVLSSGKNVSEKNCRAFFEEFYDSQASPKGLLALSPGDMDFFGRALFRRRGVSDRGSLLFFGNESLSVLFEKSEGGFGAAECRGSFVKQDRVFCYSEAPLFGATAHSLYNSSSDYSTKIAVITDRRVESPGAFLEFLDRVEYS